MMKLATMVSLLESTDIPYFVQNDHFGSMLPGPRIELLNGQAIHVAAEDEHRARELIGRVLGPAETEPEPRRPATWKQLGRMFLETLMFTWFIPSRRRGSRGADTRGDR